VSVRRGRRKPQRMRRRGPTRPTGRSDGAVRGEAEHLWWRERSRLALGPASAASAMGLFGFPSRGACVRRWPRRPVRDQGDNDLLRSVRV